jgi:hypothetical protein
MSWVDLRLVATRSDDRAFQTIGHHNLGGTAKVIESSNMGTDPIGQLLSESDLGEGVSQGAPDRDKELGLDRITGAAAVDQVKIAPASELVWASPRELLNIFQADAIGCHVITVTNDILNKLSLVGYDLGDFSLDTVKMFYNDAVAAGFKL